MMDQASEDELAELLEHLRAMLGDRKASPHPQPKSFEPCRGSLGQLARSILRGRLLLGKFFKPRLFSDPALDILLDVYASEQEGKPVDVGSCAHTARVAASTGLRYLALLEAEHLVWREPDPADRRRLILHLTPEARDSMESYLSAIRAIPIKLPSL